MNGRQFGGSSFVPKERWGGNCVALFEQTVGRGKKVAPKRLAVLRSILGGEDITSVSLR